MLSPKFLLLSPILISSGWAQSYIIQTFAGGGEPYNEHALTAHLATPTSLVLDQRGNLYVSLSNYSIVVRVDAGTVTRIAGNGTQGFSGDNGLALNAQLGGPTGLAVDVNGNVYIYDSLNYRIRKVDVTTGIITTVAGTGQIGGPPSTVGGPATSLSLSSNGDIRVDAAGNLYILGLCEVLKVDTATGLISRVAGNGQCGFSGDGGLATTAQVSGNAGIAFDIPGNLYIGDSNRIRKIEAATGIIKTVVGGASPDSLGDGGPATSAGLGSPTGLAVDGRGNIFIADSDHCRIRKVDAASQLISTIAGSGVSGYSGDGGKAIAAQLGQQLNVAVDPAGNVFISDRLGDRVRRVDVVTGLISTYAGDGPVQFSGDGEPAVYSQLAPADVAVDSHGNVYIADGGNNRVRKVDAATGVINTVAGNGGSGFSGDGGPATAAALGPAAVALDAAGNLFIGDEANRRVRKVDVATGIITTFAGGGGVNSDHGPATILQLASVSGVAVDSSGNVYVSDALDARVYKVERATGIMNLMAGTYGLKSGGDGGPGTSAPLKNPQSIAVDRSGNLYIADLDDGRVRRVDAMTGIITTVAGTLTPTVNGGDGGPATSAQLFAPSSVALDSNDNLFISEKERGFIRRVDAATHNISTIAGTAKCCLPGDDGIFATLAYLSFPQGLAVGPGGKIYFAEPQGRVRLLTRIPLDEPVIAAVENGASFSGPISPGAWIAIWGANLSPSTRAWTASDFHGSSLPLSLDGVSVTVDGKPAAISYVSPGQINAQCPDIMVTGTSTSVNVQVVIEGHLSNAFAAQVVQLAPALFSVKSPVSSGIWYVAAVHSDGALVGDPGGWGIASTRPAVGGEVISVFGTGFGPSTPPIPAGSLPARSEPLAGSAQITMGNTTAKLTYAGIVGPGLVQLNFVVPTQYAYGLQPIQASVNGVFTPYNQFLFLPVRKN